MFYFALKIKQSEVVVGTYLRPITTPAGLKTSAQWKKRLFDCERAKAS
jgi:hypothetical protein